MTRWLKLAFCGVGILVLSASSCPLLLGTATGTRSSSNQTGPPPTAVATSATNTPTAQPTAAATVTAVATATPVPLGLGAQAPLQFSAGVSAVLKAKLAALYPIRGLCYQPVPSDAAGNVGGAHKYFDSDYTNSGFPMLWGTPGRNDLANFKNNLNVNFLHLYDWSVPPAPGATVGSYQRNHVPFLNHCASNGIKVTIPISNYFVGLIHSGNTTLAKTYITAIVAEVYQGGTTPHPAAGLWSIGNEYDLNGFTGTDIATAAQYVIEAEQSLGVTNETDKLAITAPVSFATFGSPSAPGTVKVQEIITAFQANATMSGIWHDRFVACVNPFNDGTYLTNYLASTWPGIFPNLPLFFGEMGIDVTNAGGTEDKQATYVAAQLHAVIQAIEGNPSSNMVGCCVFQDQNASALKTGTEATFGITKYNGMSGNGTIQPTSYVPGGGQTYPVDILAPKPSYTSVQKAYTNP